MRDVHVSFVSYPFPAFVNPTLPIVSTLIRRGYRVSFATSEEYAPRIRQLGAEVISLPPIPLEEIIDAEESERDLAQKKLLDCMASTLPTVSSFYDLNRPTILIYNNFAIVGHILTKTLGIPGIQICSTFALDRNNFHRQLRDGKYRQDIVESSRNTDRYLEQHGLPPRDFLFSRERLNIYLFPRVLQPFDVLFGEDCFYAGRCPGEQPSFGTWHRKHDSNTPAVLVSASTMYVRNSEYFRTCIDALTDLKWHIILSVGNGDPASYGSLPKNIEIVQRTSHITILPHVSLFVCLGGIITTAEAMYHGVPLLVTSHGIKELEWQGDNIERLGIGIHLRKNDTSTGNIKKFASLIHSDAGLLERIRGMRYTVRREAGAEEAANKIEEYVDSVNV
jgi:MGT family glycosyltransferase